MSWSVPAAPTPQRRRRWPIVVAALAVVVAVAAATLIVIWWTRDGDIGPRPDWQPPAQTFLESSMSARPVPGWRTTATDLGLPRSAAGTNATRFGTQDIPFHSRPFVGNLGDSAFFIAASTDTTGTQWWLVGVGMRDGRPLFAPVKLNVDTQAPKCFLNRPDALMCLRDAPQDVVAWVIDAKTGKVTYTGPTDLQTYPSELTVHQVGIYAVAQTQSQGVYGIGPNSETTWFVPGNGSVDQLYVAARDTEPLTLASQSTPGRGSFGKVVFSLSDGVVITPELDANAQQQQTAIYPGGFAADIALSETRHEIQFFDDTGKRTSRESVRGTLVSSKPALPIIKLGVDSWAVFTPDGGRLLAGSGGPSDETILVGDRFFMRDHSDSTVLLWRQYDLRTGEQDKTCKGDLGGYIGSDGTVGVFEVGNATVGLETRAIDLATCNRLWTMNSPRGAFRDVWRINTTLVQLSDDGTELMSLVAPS